jgi:cell wall-associated NlpC family hydrolase
VPAAGRSRPGRYQVAGHQAADRASQHRASQHRASQARLGRAAGAYGRAGSVVAYAYDQLGRPYARGGTGSGGFDCSGLTMRAYARAGVRLPHRAAEQSGRPVSLSRARAGDLVKWGSHHVGVYVGRGYVIHAPKPGDHVRKARLWGNYRIVRVL